MKTDNKKLDSDHVLRSKCVIQRNMLSIVTKLFKSQNNGIHPYSLHCLSSFLEAIVLYDELIVYDYRPDRSYAYYDWGEYLDDLYMTYRLDDPRGDAVIDTLKAINWISFFDPYSEISNEDRLQLQKPIRCSFMSNDGKSVHSSGITYCPDCVVSKNETFLSEIGVDTIRDSLATLGIPEGPEWLRDEDKDLFLKLYIGNRLWQIEASRNVREATNASCILIQPSWVSFWGKEREFVLSELHKKYVEFKNTILSRNFSGNPKIDLSPITVIALDTTLTAEMLPETMMSMRKDYHELREIGRTYETYLKQADTYADIFDIVNQWRSAWEIVLKKVSKTEQPLIRRLVGWDILKKSSLKDVMLGSIETIGHELRDLLIVKGLTIVYDLEKEFLKSRRIENRLSELFGGIVK